MTNEEVQEYNSIMTDIQTYLDEFKLKFILGTEPLENFPSVCGKYQKYEY